MLFKFSIGGIPPSYNRMFQIIYSLKEVRLSPEAHAYKNKIKLSMPPFTVEERPLWVEIEYCYNWYYKNGNLKKIDTANCDKLLIDAVAEQLGIDDKFFKKRTVLDIHNPKEQYTNVTIGYLEGTGYVCSENIDSTKSSEDKEVL